MKQFEKWLKTFYKNHQGDMRYEPTSKQGWKAALEWALDELRHDANGFFNIIKELEDGD